MDLKRFAAIGALFIAATGISSAGVWAPGIVIDGSFDEWDGQVPVHVSDGSGNGGTGRDLAAIYLANDANFLYVRIQSFNADVYDGNELVGIDGDSSAATGFALFSGIRGCDTLIAGNSAFAETTALFTNGNASPASVSYGPFGSTTDVELAIPLSMTIPGGNITTSFPGGLGSQIGVVVGDANGGAGNAVGTDYTLAVAPTIPTTPTIDDFSLFDTNGNAALRTVDHSSPGFSTTRTNRAAGGPAGLSDTALQVAHSNAASAAFNLSAFSHRFATPINISTHNNLQLDVFGDPALNPANQNLFIGLIDTDGTYFARGAAAPSTAAWTTYNLGPTSDSGTWLLQAAGSNSILDLDRIIEYRIGIQENGNAVGSSSTIGYDNFRALSNAAVQNWNLFE